jgi:hypothetical protein
VCISDNRKEKKYFIALAQPIVVVSTGTMSNGLPSNSRLQESKIKFRMKQDSRGSNTVFDSTEFLAFLSSMETRSNSSVCKSKDSFAILFQSKDSISDLCNSKDSFSHMYASRDWMMNYAPTKKTSSSDSSDTNSHVAFKTVQHMTQSTMEDQDVDAAPEVATSHSLVMKSQDWVANKTLGLHVEIPYSNAIFSHDSSVSEHGRYLRPLTSTNMPPNETRWDELFMNQLMPPTASPVAFQTSEILGRDGTSLQDAISDEQELVVNHSVSQVVLPKQTSVTNALSSRTSRKRRKRTPRKKIVPDTKVYVEPKPLDVLLGRGGRSNHHPGNKRYRDEVENLKEWYNNIDSKDSKTDLSQCLVNYVLSYGARFLEHDDQGWYMVDNIVARRKASQALREDTDPDKRRAKRERFLSKRAREIGGRDDQQQDHG